MSISLHIATLEGTGITNFFKEKQIKTAMKEFLLSLSDGLTAVTDFVCGYPLFIWLIGGGLFLFLYSGCVPLRHTRLALKSLRTKQQGAGDISSFQALMSAISSTVGMGNIAGVAIAIAMGGPGAIFWMWVSALFGMATKFFEGTLAIMYKGKDNLGNVQGGPMYVLTEGISPKLRPMARFFCIFAMIGCLCVMQANQLTESLITVITDPLLHLENTWQLRALIGILIVIPVAVVMLGGITRISHIATKIVPVMVSMYFLLVFYVIITNLGLLPQVFADIIKGAFNFEAGFGGFAGVAIVGARRAMYVNEAGVGTASLMHGASKNAEPVREGLVAMLGPAIDSGLVCTLTAIPILMAHNYDAVEGIKGLYIALGAFETLIPHIGSYLLMVIVFIFAFSTMFSYSYYGTKCTGYLFGVDKARYYEYFYLAMIVVSCIITLDTVVAVMDLAFALMSIPTMFALLRLAPRVRREAKAYFASQKAE